jgi:hypothetical protein
MRLDGDPFELIEAGRREMLVADVELYVAEAVQVEDLALDPTRLDRGIGDAKLGQRVRVDRVTKLL